MPTTQDRKVRLFYDNLLIYGCLDGYCGDGNNDGMSEVTELEEFLVELVHDFSIPDARKSTV